MAAAKYLSKLNVNGQEYQIKDANAATARDLTTLEADLATKVGYARLNGSTIEFYADDSMAGGTLFKFGLDELPKVGYGEYDSENGNIVFYDIEDERSRTKLFSIDATDFIKDGMVSNVEISEGNLVITFNTDAGQEPISIALTDIFNPANYYNKTEVDGKLDLKADASNVYTKSEADGKFLTEHQSLADYPTIETMNTALGQKANVSDIYTQTEIDNKLAAKADASNVYTKAEVDEQSETTAQALSNINTQLAAKANSADLATVATSGSYNDLSDKPVIPEGAVVDAALSDTSENPVQNKVVKGALDEKVDKSDIVEWDARNISSHNTIEEFNKLYQTVANKQKVYIIDLIVNNSTIYAPASVVVFDENILSLTYVTDTTTREGQSIVTFKLTKQNDYYSSQRLYFSAEEYVTTERFGTALEQAQQVINTKQDAISDLATIRSGAALGATALQSYTETDPVFTASAAHGITAQDITAWNAKSDFSGSYNDLTDKPTIPTQTQVNVTGETLYITTV